MESKEMLLSDEEILEAKGKALASCYPQTNKIPNDVRLPELYWMDRYIVKAQQAKTIREMIKEFRLLMDKPVDGYWLVSEVKFKALKARLNE